MNIEQSLEITRFIKENKDNSKTWEEFTEYINNKFNTDLKKEAVRKRYRKPLKNIEFNIDDKTLNNEYEEHNNLTGKIIINKKIYFDENIKKTPEMILNKLGYDSNKFDLIKHKFGTWEVAMKQKNGKPIKVECCTIRAEVKPKEIELVDFKGFIDKINKIAKIIKPLKPTKINHQDLNKENLMFIPSTEAHLNKWTNNFETGHEYNIKTTLERIDEVYDNVETIQSIYNCDSCLMVVGSDYFNHESNKETTKGTTQNGEVSNNEMFMIGLDDHIKRIKYLNTKFKNVYVMFEAGNHAQNNETMLYIALQRIFSEYDNIIMEDDYRLTQAFKWGETGLFFNHGDVNEKRLEESIIGQFYKEWGETKHRYLIKGHIHKKEFLTQDSGLNVITTPSICENDDWHDKNRFGCGNNASAEIFIINKQKGIINDIIVSFDKKKRKVLSR